MKVALLKAMVNVALAVSTWRRNTTASLVGLKGATCLNAIQSNRNQTCPDILRPWLHHMPQAKPLTTNGNTPVLGVFPFQAWLPIQAVWALLGSSNLEIFQFTTARCQAIRVKECWGPSLQMKSSILVNFCNYTWNIKSSDCESTHCFLLHTLGVSWDLFSSDWCQCRSTFIYSNTGTIGTD